MRVLCISCSNIEVAREHSASTRACELVGDLLREESLPGLEVEVLPLIDYEMVPCRMCGGCLKTGKCVRDEAFNIVFAKLHYYQNALLDPLAGALASVGMQPIGAGEEWPNGVTFGIKSLAKRPDSVFVDIQHDWMEVRERIQPLVSKVLSEVHRMGKK